MKRKAFYLLALMMMPLSLLAQSDDFGVWTSIGAEKKI